MVNFEVTLSYMLEETLTVSVKAKDEDSARERVQKIINSSLGDNDTIATKLNGDWETENEFLRIDYVNEE